MAERRNGWAARTRLGWMAVLAGGFACAGMAAETAAPVATPADFAVDRSVMSDKYWSIWNDDVQRGIDA